LSKAELRSSVCTARTSGDPPEAVGTASGRGAEWEVTIPLYPAPVG